MLLRSPLRDEVDRSVGLRTRSRGEIADTLLVRFGVERLFALCEATGHGSEAADFIKLFERMVRPWGEQKILTRPRYRCSIADDEAPYEFSIAVTRSAPEVQFYVEAQGEPPGLLPNMAAGRALLEAVATELGFPLERFRAVESLLLPSKPRGPFTIWTGASWAPDRGLRLKIYLNPQVRGRDEAPAVTAEAMARLGFRQAWSALEEGLALRGSAPRDEVAIIALDLRAGNEARTKVYVRHHRIAAPQIEELAQRCLTYRHGDATRFYMALAGHQGPFTAKPPITEAIFTSDSLQRPRGITLEFPISSYVPDDAVARARVLRCLDEFGLPREVYDRAIRTFGNRPLDARSGVHAHVTLSHPAPSASRLPHADAALPNHGSVRSPDARLAVYLASEAYIRDSED